MHSYFVLFVFLIKFDILLHKSQILAFLIEILSLVFKNSMKEYF